MTSAVILEPYGFNSWLDLYREIVRLKLGGDKAIKIQKRKSRPRGDAPPLFPTWDIEELELDLDHIKARAFEEILEQLPTPLFMQTVKALIALNSSDLEKAEVIIRSLDDFILYNAQTLPPARSADT